MGSFFYKTLVPFIPSSAGRLMGIANNNNEMHLFVGIVANHYVQVGFMLPQMGTKKILRV